MLLHYRSFIIWLVTATTTASWIDRNSLSSLVDGVDHTIAACEEDNLQIQCRNKYNKIVIKDAFYGRDNYFTCTSKIFKADKLCSEPSPHSVAEKVHLMCSGENRCKIPATSTFLETDGHEICPDIRKYLKVKYSCHQNPHLQMVCQNGCPNTCWPMCQASCCHPAPPPPPAPVVEQMPNSAPTQKIISIHHQAMMISPQQCGNGCSSNCAPLCQPTCCQSQSPSLMMAPMTASVCPGDCSGACLPLCDPTCCASKKKQQSALQQKVVAPLPLSCPGSCSAACAPSCDMQCCAQQSQCSNGCPQSCAPACNSLCCSHQSMMIQPVMQPALPPQAPTCPMGCSSQCAPLCQPTCCQSAPASSAMMAPPPPQRGVCPFGCPASCLPMCQPICCSRGSAQAPPMMPPMAPPQPMMMPIMQQPPLIPMPLQPQMLDSGCSPMCTAPMCAPTCSPRCCVSSIEPSGPQAVTEDEISARRTYQEMLKKFRERQIQSYFRRG